MPTCKYDCFARYLRLAMVWDVLYLSQLPGSVLAASPVKAFHTIKRDFKARYRNKTWKSGIHQVLIIFSIFETLETSWNHVWSPQSHFFVPFCRCQFRSQQDVGTKLIEPWFPGKLDQQQGDFWRGTPKWMVYIIENPMKMDDLGIPPFMETHFDQVLS